MLIWYFHSGGKECCISGSSSLIFEIVPPHPGDHEYEMMAMHMHSSGVAAAFRSEYLGMQRKRCKGMLDKINGIYSHMP
jgi:hypothetical protein